MLIIFIVSKLKHENLILSYIVKYFKNYAQVNGAIPI